MNRVIAVSLAALALAGCNQEPSVSLTNATAEQVAEKTKAAGMGGAAMKPGRWEARVTVNALEMPGLPEEAIGQMKSRMAQQQAFTSCLTPEEAANPKGDLFRGKNPSSCKYDRFDMGGGKIDAVMTCSIQGATQTTALKGTYGPESYRMAMESSGAAGSGPMAGGKISMTMDAKRTGECKGDEQD